MGNSSSNGKNHVISVYSALKDYLLENDITIYPEAIQRTVEFIVSMYNNIESVQMKYDFEAPDFESDLKVLLKNKHIISINLFSFDGHGKIQPKNPGIKSFLTTYFRQEKLQILFNELFEVEYKIYLQHIISTKENVQIYDKIPQLKSRVKELYTKFDNQINPIRRGFLFNLRERLFELLSTNLESLKEDLEEGFTSLLLLNSTNIITTYTGNGESKVEQWMPAVNFMGEIEIYRKGNDTVGIRIGQHGLTLRLKFESSPTSSLKLATSYDLFPEESTRATINLKSLERFRKSLSVKYPECHKNDPNAIGKCNEALIYASIIESFPTIYQVDDTEYRTLYETYASKVKESTLTYLRDAANSGVEVMCDYLIKKYGDFNIESIHLVPQSYIKNKLDTADLKLTLQVNSKSIDEDFSLKAISKRGSALTLKNPGAGTILGPQFFNCGTMDDVISVTKDVFEVGMLNHKESLAEISASIGKQLEKASQENLVTGLEALLGKAVTIVTFYQQLQSEFYEHSKIDTKIEVFPNEPTPINTKLVWNNGKENITLRVKFGAGQHHGWSSIKLVAGYVVG